MQRKTAIKFHALIVRHRRDSVPHCPQPRKTPFRSKNYGGIVRLRCIVLDAVSCRWREKRCSGDERGTSTLKTLTRWVDWDWRIKIEQEEQHD